MVFQLGIIFSILGYQTLSLGWPVNWGRRGGMVHRGCGNEMEEKFCSRAFYRPVSHSKAAVIALVSPRVWFSTALNSSVNSYSTVDARSHLLFTQILSYMKNWATGEALQHTSQMISLMVACKCIPDALDPKSSRVR